MLTKEERIAVVSARLRGMKYEQTRADFARKFRKPCPTRLAIKNLVNKFQRTCSVADEEPHRMRSIAVPLLQPGNLVESWVFLKPLYGELLLRFYKV